jgi:hypothetical protein
VKAGGHVGDGRVTNQRAGSDDEEGVCGSRRAYFAMCVLKRRAVYLM